MILYMSFINSDCQNKLTSIYLSKIREIKNIVNIDIYDQMNNSLKINQKISNFNISRFCFFEITR